MAIWREVDKWRSEADRPPLILNLSVGWEPIHASATSTLGLQVRAVLEDAVCRGALVVAAAGNRRSGPPELETPLLPAAFELVPAPSAANCQALLEDGASPGPESNTDYKPLVFAVGGVQPDDRRPYKPRLLSNSRPNATPRLVAYGDHAVVSKRGRDRSLKILTGTSVSTLVVSAAAGERWRLDPDLGSFDLMQDLFNEGMETGIRSDFDLDSARPLARQVFVHNKPAVPPPPWPAGEPALVLTSPAVSMSFSAITSLNNCNPGILRGAQVSAGDPELCPQRLLDIRLQPGLGPQPDSGHNPGCRFGNGSPGTLWLEFDPCYRVQGKPVRLSDLTLIVADRAYRLPVEPFWLGDPSLPCPMNTPDDPRRKQVVLTDFNLERPLHPMYLAVTVNNTRATLSPILQLLDTDGQGATAPDESQP
ncbi:MAG TPA: S8/S53 family peptidase [Acidobacteriota bacterium]|nr:S8/S53 family peptidase [Acidobacteriota bacterium]